MDFSNEWCHKNHFCAYILNDTKKIFVSNPFSDYDWWFIRIGELDNNIYVISNDIASVSNGVWKSQKVRTNAKL